LNPDLRAGSLTTPNAAVMVKGLASRTPPESLDEHDDAFTALLRD
jgi:hypothetical protein